MPSLIPTPDAPPAAVAAAVTVSFGVRDLAGRARARIHAGAAVRTAVHIAVLTAVAAYGVVVVGTAGWSWSVETVVAAVLAGSVGGVLAVRLDQRLTRRAFRRTITASCGLATAPPVRPLARPGTGRRQRGLARAASTSASWLRADDFTAVGAIGLVTIAVLEELVFRGVLTEAALRLGHPVLTAGGLALACAVFGVGHAAFGGQLTAKTVLGVVALGVLLVTGALLAAVLVHVIMNLAAWRATSAELA